ncbi:MAG: hypothetical protein L0312_32065 [Acidobacteria bacterium]|nr:hypothetical protein [Acidobacteriota bacterium]
MPWMQPIKAIIKERPLKPQPMLAESALLFSPLSAPQVQQKALHPLPTQLQFQSIIEHSTTVTPAQAILLRQPVRQGKANPVPAVGKL